MASSRLPFGAYAGLATALFGLASYRYYAPQDPPDKAAVLAGALVQGLGQAHYRPERLDDQFSRRLYELMLKRLDYRRQLLLQADVTRLAAYQTDLDDQTKRGTHEFLDLSTRLVAERTRQAQALVQELLAQPFTFDADESFQTDFEKVAFPASAAEQREQWRKQLKYEVLARLAELLDEQDKRRDRNRLASLHHEPVPAAPAAERGVAELEVEARQRVRTYYAERFAEQQPADDETLARYANAIANTYDPHTDYLAPQRKEDFDFQLTGRMDGIGALLRERDGLIYIEDVVPGSAAFRQGELKKGDAILRVGQGAAEPVSIEGWHTGKAIPLIKGKKGTEVRLTVRRADGSTRVISIIRDVVINEATYAQSAVITEPDGRKIGYLRLPVFYADFNGEGGRSSAEDVKKELARLTAEGVQGVVFDLRENGGGSLRDAVDMAGLFLPSGPMVQVRDGRGTTTTLTDRDPRVQYAGPLVVLVNKHSASASEILAAAIQDYKRGVVIGTPTTYGKGTVQRIVDLDDVLPAALNTYKPLGSLKFTIQKFYRVTGSSTQFRGVVPDIVLPDAASSLDEGEKEADYALPWDEIPAASYKPWDAQPHFARLEAGSRARVAASPGFRQLAAIAQTLRKRQSETLVPLQLAKFRARRQQLQAESEKYGELQAAAKPLTLGPLTADRQALQGDSTQLTRIMRFTRSLPKDLVLGEAVAVLRDAQ